MEFLGGVQSRIMPNVDHTGKSNSYKHHYFTTITQRNTQKTYELGTLYKYRISLKAWLWLTLLTRLDLQLITEKFPRPTRQENNTKITITFVKLSP
jgi:hypothetical protein